MYKKRIKRSKPPLTSSLAQFAQPSAQLTLIHVLDAQPLPPRRRSGELAPIVLPSPGSYPRADPLIPLVKVQFEAR